MSAAPGRPVYLVTSAGQPELGDDDRLLRRALDEAGVPCRVAVWTDDAVDWGAAGVCLLRSVWDYHRHPDRFRAWLATTAAVTTVLNPPELVAWNLHKRYLRELAAGGVPTVETIWISPGHREPLSELLARRGWARALLKPAVSASAWLTAEVRAGEPAGEQLLREILRHTDAMLQPYLDGIDRHGEVSAVAVAGTVTHAARRPSALHGDLAATRLGAGHPLTPAEHALATRVLHRLPVRPLYARIDLVRDRDRRLLVGEVELIEPVLYLRHGRPALRELVAHLARRTQPTRTPT